jgi:hypothetical protein
MDTSITHTQLLKGWMRRRGGPSLRVLCARVGFHQHRSLWTLVSKCGTCAEDADENEGVGEADEEVEDEEEDDEAAIAAKRVQAVAVKPAAAQPEAVKKEPAAVKKHITTEESRMQVAGVVRNFLLENASENAAGKPG